MNGGSIFIFAATAWLCIGCAERGGPTIVSVKEPPSGEIAYMTALLRNANLEIIDGCLRVVPEPGDYGYLGVFPYGFTLNSHPDGYVVLDSRGNEWSAVGTAKEIGGGCVKEVNQARVTDLNGCKGPFWIVNP